MIYQKELSSIGNYDVVVLGGGPAGVCAAMEAAQNGAKVLLCEATGMLGGMATTAMVSPFMTNYDRDGERTIVKGLFYKIAERLNMQNSAIMPEITDSPSVYTSFITRYHKHVTPFNSFDLQVVLDSMLEEAGVDVLLYTRFTDSIVENGKIKGAVICCLEGLRYVTAKVYIDATGNADVAYTSGVETHKGDEINNIPQPATLMFNVSGVDESRYTERPQKPVKAYRTASEGQYSVNHYHVYNVDACDSKSMSEAHKTARKQVLDAYAVLRDKTPGFENAKIGQVASVLGVRESRHIHGKYTITVDDISNGTKFDDRIAAYGFGMDVHNRSEKEKGNFKIEVAKVYYIPYRSMLPIGCDNLLVAGKTISCESQAAGGLRCMPCAMAMGQAAGAAAALSVKNNVFVEKVDITELQSILKEHGAIID